MQRFAKPVVFVACLIPAARIVYLAFTDRLTANPIEYVTRATGYAALMLLVVSLGVTPLRRLSGLGWLTRLRRMLGLFAFFYATVHLGIYLGLDQTFDLGAILEDLGKRPYIMVGTAAILMMTPLAVTSTKGWVKRLGGKRWQALHRLAYPAAIAGVVHYLWLVKLDKTLPLLWGGILAALLGFRIALAVRRASSAAAIPSNRRA